MLRLADAEILKRLAPPSGRVAAVLDTDTYNEVDDQFALVQCLLSPEKLDLQAVYAAPFHNERSTGPGHGMELSYEEILRVFERLGRAPGPVRVLRGSDRWLRAEDDAVESPAACDLIARARSLPAGDLLYVIAIGAITNVVSALHLAPDIAARIVVVWLGGAPRWAASAREFNLSGDLRASQALFNTRVPLVQIPCQGVAELLATTLPELERYVEPCGAIGRFLTERVRAYAGDPYAWSKVIWDIAAPAWILNVDWAPAAVFPCPRLRDDQTWELRPDGHPMAMATWVKRDAIYADLFRKLTAAV